MGVSTRPRVYQSHPGIWTVEFTWSGRTMRHAWASWSRALGYAQAVAVHRWPAEVVAAERRAAA